MGGSLEGCCVNNVQIGNPLFQTFTGLQRTTILYAHSLDLSCVCLFFLFHQQLNFYSFRKIKYHDTLRIDPKLEAETANYWRFKHEHFQRDKAELLSKIKRMQGTTAASSASTTSAAGKNSTTDLKVGAGAGAAPHSDVVLSSTVTTEVQTLKLRIEEMTKNIDELTAMVKEVSLKQEDSSASCPSPQQPASAAATEEYYIANEGGASMAGAKRKKWSSPPTIGGWAGDETVRPDEMVSSMDLDEIIASPVVSMPMPDGLVRESSTSSSQISDIEFVDTLFTVFKDEQGDDVFVLEDDSDDLGPQQQELPSCTSSTEGGAMTMDDETNNNRPDDELMRRLSDALMLLPKETQEIIVNRLIAAITSTDFAPGIVHECKTVASNNKVEVEGCEAPDVPLPQTVEEDHQAHYPLAAATLAALLRHYTVQLQHGKSPTANKSGTVEKSIPVIPVHA